MFVSHLGETNSLDSQLCHGLPPDTRQGPGLWCPPHVSLSHYCKDVLLGLTTHFPEIHNQEE